MHVFLSILAVMLIVLRVDILQKRAAFVRSYTVFKKRI